MNKKILIFLFLSLFLVSGCSNNASLKNSISIDAKDNINQSGNISSSTESVKFDWQNVNNEKDCLSHNGVWGKKCQGKKQTDCPDFCSLTFPDADKPCGDSGECLSGYCLTDIGPLSKKEIEFIINNKKGHCQTNSGDPSYQCGAWLKEGKRESGGCID